MFVTNMYITQDDNIAAFPARLKLRRLELSLTQEHVAAKVGISMRCLQQYESGDRNPRTPELVALCQVLHCTPNDLLGYE